MFKNNDIQNIVWDIVKNELPVNKKQIEEIYLLLKSNE